MMETASGERACRSKHGRESVNGTCREQRLEEGKGGRGEGCFIGARSFAFVLDACALVACLPAALDPNC